MTVKSRSHARQLVSFVTVVLVSGALAFACADNKRILGEECIKSDDCQSGICTGQKCTAAPPILDRDASPPAVDASSQDATTDGDAATAADSAADSADDSASDAAGGG